MEGLKEFDKKNGPKIKILGEASVENKKRAELWAFSHFDEEHLANLSEEQREKLERLEYSIKSPEELLIIGFADEEVNKLMEKCGVNPYTIPSRNLHILPPEIYTVFSNGAKNSAACTYQEYQMVIFNADAVRVAKIFFGKTVFHELMHLKGHLALEVEEKQHKDSEDKIKVDINVSVLRKGLAVGSAQKRSEGGIKERHEHFRGLEEAVVSYFEKDFVSKMLSLPVLKEEEKLSKSAQTAELKKKIAGREGINVEDIFWVGKNEWKYAMISYPYHRKVFDVLINEIQKKFSNKYDSPDKVALEFLKSKFNGNLGNMAELVDETFGDLSFRVLGLMGDDKNSAIGVLEYLRAALRNRNSKERGRYNREKDEQKLSTGV